MLFVCFNFKLASSRVTSFLATVEMGTVPERVVGACITVPRSSSSGASPIGVSFKDASFASHVLVCLQCFFFQVAIWALEALLQHVRASKRRGERVSQYRILAIVLDVFRVLAESPETFRKSRDSRDSSLEASEFVRILIDSAGDLEDPDA